MVTRREALNTLAAGWLAVRARHHAGELLIRGGRIVNYDGVRDADVRVVEQTITEIGGSLRAGAGARVIEARGNLVLPGGIDPHTHLHPSFVDDLTSGSMAALAGGITTVGTFATAQQNETLVAAIERMNTRVRSEAIADVILHAAAWPPAPEIAAQLPALVAAGQPSFKIYLTRADAGAQTANLIRFLEAARDVGVVTMVHCEDGAMLAAAVRRLQAEGRTSLENYGASRPIVAEVAATQQIAALCESTSAPVYLVHLSCARALDACAATRASGAPLFIETRPMYLHLNDEKLKGPDAALYVGQPPLRPESDRLALWRGITDGRINVLATDHAPWTRAQKLDPSLTVARVRPGVSDLQFMLPMYFSEGVGKRKLPLQRFVETTSTNAARIFGLYPHKGVIREGADADIAIWDPNRTANITAEADFSKSDYSVYEGWKVTGWPIMTIRRGEIVYEQGRVLGPAGSGKLYSRNRWQAQ